MVEDDDKKEEEKFDFTREGETLGYISLEQARVQAMEHAQGDPSFYGRRYRGVTLAHQVVDAQEGEDYYDIKLSFRPAGRFQGEPGIEQFIIDKVGSVRVRQILDEPSDLGQPARRRPPLLLLSAVGVVLAVVAAVTRRLHQLRCLPALPSRRRRR